MEQKNKAEVSGAPCGHDVWNAPPEHGKDDKKEEKPVVLSMHELPEDRKQIPPPYCGE